MNDTPYRRKRMRDTEILVSKQNIQMLQMADMDTDMSKELTPELNSDDPNSFNQKLLGGILGIQQTLNNLVLKFDSQTEEINTLKNDIYARDGIEDRLQAVTVETEDQTSMITELKDQNARLVSELNLMKSYVVHLESRLDSQQNQISSLVERSMRENAIVTGLKERHNENTKAEVLTLIKTTLKIEKDIKIDRAHRIGSPANTNSPRPIVVKFHDYTDREYVINWAKTLNRQNKETLSGIYINPQFPDDMRECRKRLIQVQKDYKEKEVETHIKGNSLIFNRSGAKYAEKVCIPKAAEILDMTVSKHGKFNISSSDTTSDSNHSYCASAARTTTYAEVREASRQILQSPVSANTYNTLVYRFTDKDGRIHDGYDDDRDYGTGSRILTYLKENDVTDVTIISSRTPPRGVAKISSRKNTVILDAVKSVLRKM